MFEKKFCSLIQGVELQNPKEDYKASKRFGQYRISEKALYKADGTYVPFSGVKECLHDQTDLHVSGCCGTSVMVDRVIFVAEAGKIPLIFDNAKQVEEVLAHVNAKE